MSTKTMDRGEWRWWLALAAAFALMIAVNPIGYIGGGADDWQYLNAARCWRAFGPCLPHDHWQSRWPIIAPLAAMTAIFGESRASAEFAPLVESVVCLLLLAVIGNRLFGRPVGWIAALFLVATPVFAIEALEPAAEPIELAFILGGVWAATRWADSCNPRWAFAAGALLSLAIQVRETALVAAVLVGTFLLVRSRPDRSSLAMGLAGFAIPFVVEFAWLAISADDPFWRLRLAVRHTQLPSSELLGPIDTRHPPFFNRNYIAHWNFVPGIHVYWALDGLVNLFVNAVAGFSLALAIILLPFSIGRISGTNTRSAAMLWLSAIAYCCILIYAFAIDPKPRMFLPALACSNLALAVLTWSFWKNGSRALAAAIWITTAAIGTVYVYAAPQTSIVDDRAAGWIASHPGQVETNAPTRQMLTFVTGAQALPLVGSGRSFLLYESNNPCSEWAASFHATRDELTLVGEMQRSRLRGIHHELGHSLCLFRYRSAGSGAIIRDLLQGRDIL